MARRDVRINIDNKLSTLIKASEFAVAHGHPPIGMTNWELQLLKSLYAENGGDILIGQSKESKAPFVTSVRLIEYSDDLEEITKAGLTYNVLYEYREDDDWDE